MAVFEADPEGFRAMQLGRPAAHLVRELVQNVFDEATGACRVTVEHEAREGVTIVVEDDVPGGIRDEKLVFTIWASDKADSPTKRGRMGRGLKELVSVSDRTVVATQGRPAIEFVRRGGEWKRRHTTQIAAPATGTRIESLVRGWKAKDAKEIGDYLRRVRPPSEVKLFVNGVEVVRRPAIETHQLYLTTVVYKVEEGERRVSNPHERAAVELFAEDGGSWVYEMGLPIEPIEYPLSIDVGQRVPLREQRDTMLTSYARELYAQLLNARLPVMPKEQLRDNHVLKAAEAWPWLTAETKKAIAHAWTDGKPFASTPQQMSIATGAHIAVVNLRSLPEAIRDIVKQPGISTSVRDVLDARREEFCPVVVAPTDAMRRFCAVWEWVARGVGRPCSVVVREGQPGAGASFERGRNELAIYRAAQIIPDFFDWPLKAHPLSTLIHELSHWKAVEESHGEAFYSDVDDVGGAVAQFLIEHADEALAMARQGEGEPVRPPRVKPEPAEEKVEVPF